LSKEYDVCRTKSVVGALTDYFRTKFAAWRSEVPIFSFAGEGSKPQICEDGVIYAFGVNSVFEQLIKKNGLIMFYGTDLQHATFLHYCEQMSGVLTYRYYKTFGGKIFNYNQEKDVTLKLHVRPLKKVLDYDFKKLENDLYTEGLLKKNSPFKTYLIKAKYFSEYVIYRMKKDPFYLLTEATRSWVEPQLQKLGRPFLITDFE
jgi:aminoglycoside 3-N-acetyltransferase